MLARLLACSHVFSFSSWILEVSNVTILELNGDKEQSKYSVTYSNSTVISDYCKTIECCLLRKNVSILSADNF